MHDWLSSELDSIEPNTVHLIDGPVDRTLRAAIEANAERFPRDYIDFVLAYGNARFFKRRGIYSFSILLVPECVEREGDRLYKFGEDAGDDVFFWDRGMGEAMLPGVYEVDHKQLEIVGPDFSEWLRLRYQSVRGLYSRNQWKAAIRGPQPFSASERAIVEARTKYRWSVEGVTDLDAIRIRVANGSTEVLQFLTLAVRSLDGEIEGAVWLPVGGIGPGCETVLEVNCYPGQIPPSEVVLSDMPVPTPGTRDSYRELR